METSSSQSVYDFLDRMRNPASVDLVRSIKSFIVSFSFYTANPENDGKRLQDFLLTMEATIRDHSLWIGAIEEEIDSAIEGLEKYVMTKLFSRTFASSLDDAKMDQDISDKICLLQTFMRPEHLDIPTAYQNEASWLLAVKELQKINAFKAPREKLCCILNCCRVINNLLLNASFSEDHVPGADDFLPVLIYVAIKISPSTALSLSFVGDVNSLMLFESRKHLKRSVLANPPQLHSNLKFIQLYRRQEKLISEAAYYFTNLVSAKSFIVDLDAKSLSMEEPEFLESMQRARLAVRGTQIERPPALVETTPLSGSSTRMNNKVIQTQPLPMFGKTATLAGETDPWHSITGGSSYPFMEAEAGELTVGDVERLLSLYKDVVNKYTSLHRAFRHTPIPEIEPPLPHSEESNIVLIQSGEKM